MPIIRLGSIGIIIGILGYIILYTNYSKPKTYVIVGTSAASISAVLELIKHTYMYDSIIVISKDEYAPYDRTKLKRYLKHNTIPFIPISHACASRVSLIKAEVTKIDHDKKEIVCNNNKTVSYDYLFLGIGLEPRIPSEIEYAQGDGVFGYYTLHNTHIIKEYLKHHTVDSIVVIGGGLSSLEISQLLASQGYRIHHCVRGPRILQDKADDNGAYIIQDFFKKNGVQWHFNATIKRIIHNNGIVTHVELNDGSKIATDMVIYAIGGALNSDITAFLDKKNGTLLVDACMRTSDPYIYAGGDATSIWDYVNETYMRNTKWNAAIKQGLCAALNMCGKEKIYYGTACIYNARYFDIPVALSGPIANPPQDYTYIQEHDDNEYRSFLVKDNQLKGFCLINIPRKEIKKYTAILKNDN